MARWVHADADGVPGCALAAGCCACQCTVFLYRDSMLAAYAGDVELRNLALRPEALADLDLPITVRAGLLGRLTIKVIFFS